MYDNAYVLLREKSPIERQDGKFRYVDAAEVQSRYCDKILAPYRHFGRIGL